MIDIFRRRKNAYARVFRHENGVPLGDAAVILADLKRFARLPDAPLVRGLNGHGDPMVTGLMMGRQEVVNRILTWANIDPIALLNLKEQTDD